MNRRKLCLLGLAVLTWTLSSGLARAQYGMSPQMSQQWQRQQMLQLQHQQRLIQNQLNANKYAQQQAAAKHRQAQLQIAIQQNLTRIAQQKMPIPAPQPSAPTFGFPRPEGYAWLQGGRPYYWVMEATGPKVYQPSNYDPDWNYKKNGPRNVVDPFGEYFSRNFR